MTVCKFFLQGYCKFGSSCRFEHPSGGNAGYAYSAQRQLFGGGGRGGSQSYGGGGRGGGQSFGGGGKGGGRFQQNQYKWQSSDYSQQNKPVTSQMSTNDVINSLISDMSEWESMWPFSCLAFEKDCPNIPDFVDTSPEELRAAAYEASQSGNFQSYIQQEHSLSEEYKQKRLQVKNMNMTMKQKLVSMIEDYRLNKNNRSGSFSSGSASLFSKPFGTSGSGSAFGTTGTSSFGPLDTGSTNIFGAAGTNVFGATGTSTFGATGTSAFGTSGTSGFGSSGALSNPFGASAHSFGNQSTTSTFGTQQSFGDASPGVGAFGSQGHQTENKTFSGFGSTFGSQSGTSPLNFTSQANPTVTTFGHSTSNTNTIFASGVTQTGFGSTTFGNKPQSGLFGKTESSPAANLFGSFTSQPQNTTSFPSTSRFGSGGTASGFSSVGASASVLDTQKYTPLDQLTPEELEAFQAPTFTLGLIPTRPPPKDLVF